MDRTSSVGEAIRARNSATERLAQHETTVLPKEDRCSVIVLLFADVEASIVSPEHKMAIHKDQ